MLHVYCQWPLFIELVFLLEHSIAIHNLELFSYNLPEEAWAMLMHPAVYCCMYL